MQALVFSFNGVAPIALMVLLGMVLRRRGIMDDKSANVVNKLCFELFIPIKVFAQLYRADLSADVDVKTLLFILCATLVVLIALVVLVPRFVQKGTHCGEFIQGVFRGNSAILGLPLVISLYGESAGTALALPLPLVIIIYNIFSPMVLARYAEGEKPNARAMLKKVATNPFLIAAVAGLLVSLTGITPPQFLSSTLNSLGAVGSPLALIGLGAMTRMRDFQNAGALAFKASVLRLVVIPALVLPAAALMGIQGVDMAAVVCFFCTPTAVGGYVLAKNMDGDGELAGQILLQTTLLSLITMFVTLLALSAAGMM